MIGVTVSGRGKLRLEYLILDLNGTIALDGEIIGGVAERINQLSQLLDIFIVTADTRGNAEKLTKDLKAKLHKIKPGEENAQKLALVLKLGKDKTVSIGNGSNDVSMLKESAIGICILGKEGASTEAVMASDLVVSDINDGLDLLIKSERLVASLRR